MIPRNSIARNNPMLNAADRPVRLRLFLAVREELSRPSLQQASDILRILSR